MAKIQITDDADAKKESSANNAARKPATSSVSKKSVRKVSVDTTSVTPKKIKKIKVEKTEKKTPKQSSKKSVKVEKAEPKKTEVAVKKASAKAEEKTEITVKKASIKVEEKSEPKPHKSSKTIKHESSKSAVSSNATHSILQKSTTLSRRYVKRPEGEPAKKETEKTDNPSNAESATPIIIQGVSAEPVPEEVSASEPTSEEISMAPEPISEPALDDTSASESTVKVSIKATPVTTDKPDDSNTIKINRAQAKKERQAEKLARAEAKLAEKRARAEAEAARKAKAKAERAAAIEAARAKKAAEIKAARARREAAIVAAREAKLARKQAKAAMPTLKTAKSSTGVSKDQAIRSAMRSVATMNTAETPKEMHREFRKKKKGGRIALALLCSAVTVGALVAFVHFNMPDISVRVAAMQTGIDASYPNIIPRGYTLSNVSSDKDGEIAMVFNNSEGNSFTLTEEKSTWDSNALLNNFVKKNMSADYSTMREQGITIYTEGDLSTWVNGGILFKVKSSGKFLTKEQIRNLATSI